jgi:ABC-type uncharacterized transport system ATPase subunit
VEKPEAQPGAVVLTVRDLRQTGERGHATLAGVDLEVHIGEIFGIAGVEGNGQSELVQAITEPIKLDGGDILLEGESILTWNVRTRRDAGIGHIPEDRQRFGLLLPFSLADNIVLGQHHRAPFVKGGQLINTPKIREFAQETIRSYDIRTPSDMTPANALSGGNQQKVIVARELRFEPKLLVASQPTRGVDIGATEFIYSQLIAARQAGKAVLLISADLDEILYLSDRIGVMFKGRIIKEFTQEEATREQVGLYMTGEQESG